MHLLLSVRVPVPVLVAVPVPSRCFAVLSNDGTDRQPVVALPETRLLRNSLFLVDISH